MEGLGALFAFALVVALIPVALWLLRRSPIGAAAAGGRALRSVQTLPLSASQRIVTIEVGQGAERRWLVLGVTPSTITPLHTMAPQDDPAASPAPPPFGDLLARLRAPRPPGDDHAAR
jgi:flagellar protein FliO/FliZ